LDFNPRDSPKLGINEQLETPVIYFYTPSKMDVKVEVGYPNGLITEVYPQMSKFTPALGGVTAVSKGTAQWDVTVHEKSAQVKVPTVHPRNIWAPSRRVSSNMVTNQQTGENEHFIFYRGVGQRQSEVSVKTTVDKLTVFNTQAEDVAEAFLMVSDGVKGNIISLGRINGFQSVSTDFIEADLPLDLYLSRAEVMLEMALTTAGLFPLEARAMVQTWTYSYFLMKGIRVLFVAPQVWTEQNLPLTVTPTPKHIKRVLVGRVEVMTFTEEQRVVKALDSVKNVHSFAEFQKALDSVHVPAFGRFGESKLLRAAGLVLSVGPKFMTYINEYIDLRFTH
jgi:hypothetical protein